MVTSFMDASASFNEENKLVEDGELLIPGLTNPQPLAKNKIKIKIFLFFINFM
jgi:hypothetical protein